MLTLTIVVVSLPTTPERRTAHSMKFAETSAKSRIRPTSSGKMKGGGAIWLDKNLVDR